MNGYLVMLRCQSDDVPLLLTADIEEAREFAKNYVFDNDSPELDMLSIDVTPDNVSIYVFKDGRMVNYDVVNTFEDDE